MRHLHTPAVDRVRRPGYGQAAIVCSLCGRRIIYVPQEPNRAAFWRAVG